MTRRHHLLAHAYYYYYYYYCIGLLHCHIITYFLVSK